MRLHLVGGAFLAADGTAPAPKEQASARGNSADNAKAEAPAGEGGAALLALRVGALLISGHVSLLANTR